MGVQIIYVTNLNIFLADCCPGHNWNILYHQLPRHIRKHDDILLIQQLYYSFLLLIGKKVKLTWSGQWSLLCTGDHGSNVHIRYIYTQSIINVLSFAHLLAKNHVKLLWFINDGVTHPVSFIIYLLQIKLKLQNEKCFRDPVWKYLLDKYNTLSFLTL